MFTTQDLALRFQFRERLVLNPEHLPHQGPVLLAPTHRARWDALMLPMAAGRRVSGRDCRFMVTTTEMRGYRAGFCNGSAASRWTRDGLDDHPASGH